MNTSTATLTTSIIVDDDDDEYVHYYNDEGDTHYYCGKPFSLNDLEVQDEHSHPICPDCAWEDILDRLESDL